MTSKSLAEAITHAKTKSGARPSTLRVVKFRITGTSPASGWVVMAGRVVEKVHTFAGFNATLDAKWDADTRKWIFTGWKGIPEDQKVEFLNAIDKASAN